MQWHLQLSVQLCCGINASVLRVVLILCIEYSIPPIIDGLILQSVIFKLRLLVDHARPASSHSLQLLERHSEQPSTLQAASREPPTAPFRRSAPSRV